MGGFSRVKSRLILYSTQATHPTGAYFGFYSKFYSPLDGMEVYHKVTSAISGLPGNPPVPVPIYTPGWRETHCGNKVIFYYSRPRAQRANNWEPRLPTA